MIAFIIGSSIITLLHSCPAGQYTNPASSSSCLMCSSYCLSCLNISTCYVCQSNYYISNKVCRACRRDSGCFCDGVEMSCQQSNIGDILLIVAIPVCFFIVSAFLAYFIREKCCRPRVQAQPVYDEIMAQQRRSVINHLGIISSMKAKWVNSTHQAIDPSQICSICLQEDCDLIIPCLHIYHSKCLSTWVSKKTNCPTCKRSNLSPIYKYCKECRTNYIISNLQELGQHITDFYVLCSLCKEKSNRRIDSLCEMQLNQARL